MTESLPKSQVNIKENPPESQVSIKEKPPESKDWDISQHERKST